MAAPGIIAMSTAIGFAAAIAASSERLPALTSATAFRRIAVVDESDIQHTDLPAEASKDEPIALGKACTFGVGLTQITKVITERVGFASALNGQDRRGSPISSLIWAKLRSRNP